MKRFLATLLAIATPAFAQPAAAPEVASALTLSQSYSDRIGMAFLDRRCELLVPEQKLAVLAFAAQARGALLRQGVSASDLDRTRDQALAHVGTLDCGSPFVQTEAERLRKAFGGWKAIMRMELPATQRAWVLNRAGLDGWRVWQVLDGQDGAPDHVRVGLIRRETGGIRFALEVPDDDVAAVRVHLRDRSILPLSNRAQGLQPPPRAATIQFNAAEKTDGITRSRAGVEARPGTMMVFGLAETRALVRADPRDAFEVEIISRSGGVRSFVVEAGDIVVGYAFAAMS